MSERCERTSEWTSEWPSTYVLILGCSEPLCNVVVVVVVVVIIIQAATAWARIAAHWENEADEISRHRRKPEQKGFFLEQRL